MQSMPKMDTSEFCYLVGASLIGNHWLMLCRYILALLFVRTLQTGDVLQPKRSEYNGQQPSTAYVSGCGCSYQLKGMHTVHTYVDTCTISTHVRTYTVEYSQSSTLGVSIDLLCSYVSVNQIRKVFMYGIDSLFRGTEGNFTKAKFDDS